MRWTSTLLSCVFLCLANASGAEEGSFVPPPEPARVFPNVVLSDGESIRYLGTFYADGIYRQNTSVAAYYEDDEQRQNGHIRLRSRDVPPGVNLHPVERSAENYLPQSHPTKAEAHHRRAREWFDDFLTLAYGREQAFVEPRYVTTGSSGRVIVGDPAGNAVHVFDPQQSFRIVAGREYRLQSVGAVATDSQDNIYVADPDQGVIVVLDSLGRFVTTMGRFAENEGLFHHPTAIAVDRQGQLLYVLDSAREMLFALDLSGRVIWKAGGRRREMDVQFDSATALSALNGRVAVLDAQGSRVQVFNRDGKLVQRTDLQVRANAVALQVDTEGRIFLTDTGGNDMHILGADGREQARVGISGALRGEFLGAQGLWIDEAQHIYVAESGNRRVQVFELSAGEVHKGTH